MAGIKAIKTYDLESERKKALNINPVLQIVYTSTNATRAGRTSSTGRWLSLRTISYDCVFPQGSYIPRRRQTQTSYSENKGVTKPSRGKIRAIRVETGKSAVGKASVRVARDQEPEDSR